MNPGTIQTPAARKPAQQLSASCCFCDWHIEGPVRSVLAGQRSHRGTHS